jgi:hypothetical protein
MVKLQTPIKEYRTGVSVSDYTEFHSRASIGDLYMVAVEKRMKDLMKDINKDLFTEQADGSGNKVLGLEAVADSAGNTTLYGYTRSTTNRLSPAAAANTYTAISKALTTDILRYAVRRVEIEGAVRGDLRIVCNPALRDAIFELEDGNQRYFGNSPSFGFSGGPSYDGIPMIIDSDCTYDAVFIVDFASEYLVISKAPQLVGLAKVGMAQEAALSTYIAHVYEQPRRICMIDSITAAA